MAGCAIIWGDNYLNERLRDEGSPEWLEQMREYYERTGCFRAKDLRRLLGDPVRRVESFPLGTDNKELLRYFLGK